jgi:molybdate transport system ATP-binding protein
VLRVDAATRVGDLELAVALEVPPGACLALAGPSGAGKTTILRIVAGLTQPGLGTVTLDGETWLDTARSVCVAPEHRHCGYVFQDYALFGHLRAWENVAYGLRGRSRRERRDEASTLLERFNLADRADARPADLSGGERQRVALARALAPRPRVLLLDEPLSALDPAGRADAGRELAAVLAEAGVPTLLVTHDFVVAATLGDRVGVIDAGRLVQTGTAGELAATPASAFVADFTGAVVLRGTARPTREGLTLVELDGGGTVTAVEAGEGRVAVSLYPWEISLEPRDTPVAGSSRNRLEVEVTTLTNVGNRVRVGLRGGQPLVAEITEASARRLGLESGTQLRATWKAVATRLIHM